jgi:hypothetical protein
MVVLVLLIIGLAIELWHLLSSAWPLLLAVLAFYSVCRWLVAPFWHARAAAARERLRQELARREIDRIALETTRAMFAAATRGGEVIEGTATEVEP